MIANQCACRHEIKTWPDWLDSNNFNTTLREGCCCNWPRFDMIRTRIKRGQNHSNTEYRNIIRYYLFGFGTLLHWMKNEMKCEKLDTAKTCPVVFFSTEQFFNVLIHKSGRTHNYQIMTECSCMVQAKTNAADCVCMFFKKDNMCQQHATCVNIKIQMNTMNVKMKPEKLRDCNLNLGCHWNGNPWLYWNRDPGNFLVGSWLGNGETAIKIFHEFWRYLFETDFQLCLRWCCTLTHKQKKWSWTTLQIWGCHPDDQASGLLYEHWSGLWIHWLFFTNISGYFWMMPVRDYILSWLEATNRWCIA